MRITSLRIRIALAVLGGLALLGLSYGLPESVVSVDAILLLTALLLCMFPLRFRQGYIYPGPLVCYILLMANSSLWLLALLLIPGIYVGSQIESIESAMPLTLRRLFTKYIRFLVGFAAAFFVFHRLLAHAPNPLRYAAALVVVEAVQWLLQTRYVSRRQQFSGKLHWSKLPSLLGSNQVWPNLLNFFILWRVDNIYKDSQTLSDLVWLAIPFLLLSAIVYRLESLYESRVRAEEIYQMIAANTQDLIVLLTRERRIRYLSPSVERVFGAENAKSMGRYWLEFVDEERRRRFQHALDVCGATLEPQRIDVYRIGPEHNLDFECEVSPVLDGSRQFTGFVLVARDVTDRNRSFEQFRKSEKLAVIGHMAAGVAHEIRNPVTTIKGFLQLSKERFADTPQYWEIMQAEILHIEHIIGTYLSVTQSPRAEDVSDVDVNDLISQIIDELDESCQRQEVLVTVVLPSSSPILFGHRLHLKRALESILQNALDAMPFGGQLNIRLEWLVPERVIQLTIEDTGKGMDEERLRYLGEPHYVNAERGIGFGLLLSTKLIEEHNGSLDIESQLGQGTKVTIRLPTSGLSEYLNQSKSEGSVNQGEPLHAANVSEAVYVHEQHG
ncbi:ATP-binding protein [Alicyclobacillus sp. SP_1]|uniref:ATP-binding protein n=1 Tax=Alicyclobacillus sp. SP_1 TaxID=2942475 RepID=UPI002157EA91|nr:ATP-binding protein [Alicyclobacillus sp. SP_1]